jgi:hypothetical protein
MYLMVDVVTNHMGYLGCGTCVDYSVFNPFNSVRCVNGDPKYFKARLI